MGGLASRHDMTWSRFRQWQKSTFLCLRRIGDLVQ